MVTPHEMGYVLHILSVGTRRTFREDERSLWFSLLSEFTYDELHEAAMIYLKEHSGEFLQPGTLASIIKAKRRERLARMGDPDVPSGTSAAQYNAILRQAQIQATRPPKAPVPPQPSQPQIGQ